MSRKKYFFLYFCAEKYQTDGRRSQKIADKSGGGAQRGQPWTPPAPEPRDGGCGARCADGGAGRLFPGGRNPQPRELLRQAPPEDLRSRARPGRQAKAHRRGHRGGGARRQRLSGRSGRTALCGRSDARRQLLGPHRIPRPGDPAEIPRPTDHHADEHAADRGLRSGRRRGRPDAERTGSPLRALAEEHAYGVHPDRPRHQTGARPAQHRRRQRRRTLGSDHRIQQAGQDDQRMAELRPGHHRSPTGYG